MFGIGMGELMVIAFVLLIVVGPKRMPTLMKTVGKTMRELRKASTDLRAQSGIDKMLADEDVREIMDPLGLKGTAGQKPPPQHSPRGVVLKDGDLVRERPADGVDVEEARYRAKAGKTQKPAAAKPAAPLGDA